METRIKYIKKNGTEGYYVVQIKKWVFWKTIYISENFANIERFIDRLAQIDEFNNRTKSLNKIVYEGWAVRNVYKNAGIGYAIKFFKSYPSRRCKGNDESEIIWTDINGRSIPLIEINTEKLFGKECLEPMKLRITIKQIEE